MRFLCFLCDVMFLPSSNSESNEFILCHLWPPFKPVSHPKRKPSEADFVWRRGARELTQFSPKAETKLSGLCSEDKGSGPCPPAEGDGRGNCPNPVPQRRNLSLRPHGLRIFRFAASGKAQPLRRSSSSHRNRCRWISAGAQVGVISRWWCFQLW